MTQLRICALHSPLSLLLNKVDEIKENCFVKAEARTEIFHSTHFEAAYDVFSLVIQ